ncbi:glycosyltransferase [Catenovulum sp. SM1970]|uniref:glycosyltransferase n=1 Tax=Marinifaba aquimaris TaxID=2741323 RepID=UPI0015746E4E|nr:glycosyltransferase [Marinifaba aquimaris]
MSQALVSVIIPVYNSEQFLEDAIGSILNQTYANLEVICIDDGSVDSSFNILQNLMSKDSRLKIFKNPINLGISATLNKAISLSSGEYIARMDADDIALPHRLNEQVAFLEKYEDVDIVGSWALLFGDRDEVFYYRRYDEFIKAMLFFRHNGFPHYSLLARKGLYNEFEYDPLYDSVEDTELWCRIVKEKPSAKFANIQSVLTHYRVHKTQTTSLLKDKQESLYQKIIFNYLRFFIPDASHEQFKLHYQLVLRPDNLKEAELIEIGRWVQHLYTEFNKRIGDKYFAIDERWFRLCKLQKNTINAHEIYLKFCNTKEQFCFI